LTRLATVALGAVGRIAKWREDARSRRALSRLDDYALRDIGLDRATAQYIATFPYSHKQE
jgi:uncharacterized protein YjiS (DUF1127 family)